MLKLLIKKELTIALRNTRVQIFCGLILVLTLLALLLGKQGQQRLQQERQRAQAAMYNKWVNQEDKHPHSAAHYGQFAFKPKPTLSFFDIGLDQYVGTAVFLEAHKQNDASFSQAQDSNAMIRFGELTIAFVFQLLVPLLIIFLSFNLFSKEREEGTLKLIYAQGVPPAKLFFGKVYASYIIIMLIFFPVMLLAFFILKGQSDIVGLGEGGKLISLSLFYSIYFFIWVSFSVLISALSKNSGVALISLLGFWITTCIILPKASVSFASNLYPSPSHFEFRQIINERVVKGIDGHNPSDVHLDSLKTEVLKSYGVNNIDDLPVNWSGIAMQAGEEYTDKVYDQEFSRVAGLFENQNRVSEWLGFLNPYQAIRSISMGLCGTDFHHHIRFVKAAEDYRRRFVKALNKDMEVNHKPNIAYNDYTVGRNMWKKIEPFRYEMPATSEVVAEQWISCFALLFWLLTILMLSYKLSHKTQILEK